MITSHSPYCSLSPAYNAGPSFFCSFVPALHAGPRNLSLLGERLSPSLPARRGVPSPKWGPREVPLSGERRNRGYPCRSGALASYQALSDEGRSCAAIGYLPAVLVGCALFLGSSTCGARGGNVEHFAAIFGRAPRLAPLSRVTLILALSAKLRRNRRNAPAFAGQWHRVRPFRRATRALAGYKGKRGLLPWRKYRVIAKRAGDIINLWNL